MLTHPLTLAPKEAKASARGADTAGPVAWWKFDETDGASAADASGHRLVARLQGQPRWAPGQGRFGGALEFDGAKDFVDGGDAEVFDFRDSLTVSAWLKVRRFDKPSQTLLSKGIDVWQLQRHGEQGTLEFALTGPQPTGKSQQRPPVIVSKRAVDDGQWHHAVGLYDGKQVAFYLDGELQGSVGVSGPIAQNTEPVLIGENAASRGRPFNGWLDDVRLYNRGLSAEEIRALYRGGTEPAGSGAK